MVKWQIYWDKVEAQRGVYDWSAYDDQFDEFQDARLIISVRNTPAWAQRFKGYVSGPPQVQYYQDFYRLLDNIVERYHPHALEIWNEPDVPHTGISPDTWYMGAWGDVGGAVYGEFVKGEYYYIKARHTDVYIVGGAFMLDMKSAQQQQFARDAISTADKAVDVWSFHSYSRYNGQDPIGSFYDWQHKARWLSGLTDKTLWLTETSLLCDGDKYPEACGDKYENTKAAYLRYVTRNAVKEGVSLVSWYDMISVWQNSGLVRKDGFRLPAYFEYLRWK